MNARKTYSDKKSLFAGIITTAAVIVAVFALSTSSFAASSGKIAKDGVRVRQDASTNSEIVVTLAKDDSITINGQLTGADGNIWYQITTSSGANGYVRSDLATVTDGSTPGTIGADGNVTAGDPSIRLVNPVSGTVTYDQNVRVRQDASTSSTIIDSISNGTAVTINGVKNGTDGREWYYITFTNGDGKEVVGFCRSDFITPGGELTDLVTESSEPVEEEPVEEEPVVVEKKDVDTELDGADWYLMDYNGLFSEGTASKYKISDLFSSLDTYKQTADKYKKQVTGIRVWLIIFIVLAIAGIGGCVYFFMKLRESKDMAAFADAEKQRRARLAGGNSRPAGARPTGAAQGRPAQGRPQGEGNRPAGGQRPMPGPNGQRPAGARPAGARPQGEGARPAGGQRPMPGPNGQRPAGAPQGRPAGAPQGRPAGAPQGRPAGAPQGRPAGGAPQGRPVQGQRPVQRPAQEPVRQRPTDDDDFDYGFLNNKGE
ncbi:MAG: SH3 domain-containing protein [Lachnospiraceae bacterium]|nr:SH3 domain-containing protein [Lachnospiraceae bacterium]